MAGVDPIDLFLLVTLGAALITTLSLGFGGSRQARIAERLAKVRHTYDDTVVPDEDASAEDATRTSRWSSLQAALKAALHALSHLPVATSRGRAEALRQLSAAGFSGAHALELFLVIKLGCALLFAICGMVFPVASAIVGQGPYAALVTALGAALAGSVLPSLALDRLARGRRAAIAKALPDTLDLMCICVNAGYSLDVSIDRVSREMKIVAPALSTELAVTARELRFLPDRQLALRNLAERTDLPSVRSLVVTLVQAQKFGTPLTVALKTLAETERRARILGIEEQAAKLPALITLPLILFILPTVMIVIGTPAALQVLAIVGN